MKRIALLFAVLLAAASAHAGDATFRLDIPGQWFQPLVLTEGQAPITMTVIRGGDMSKTVDVSYEWSTGNYGNGHFTFAPNETSQTFTMTVPNDNVYTGGFFGFVRLYIPSTGVDYRDVKVLDNEPAPAINGPASVSVAEGNSGTTPVTLHYQLSGPIARFAWPFVSVVAPKDVSYSIVQPAQMAANQTDFTVVVNIQGNTDPAPDQVLDVNIGIRLDAEDLVTKTQIVVLNDEYLLSPATQQIERGATGSIDLSTSVAASSTERVTLSCEPSSVATVPPFIDIPAGATSASVPITGLEPGVATVTATFPASRGGRSQSSTVSVFAPTGLTFERPAISMSYGSQTTAVLHVAPPPAAPLTLVLRNSNPKVVDVPAAVTVGSDGTGSFAVRAIGTGFSFVSVTLPPELGAVSGGVAVDVTPATGLSITNLSQRSGPATGEQSVTVMGNNMTGRCTVTFGGVAALNMAVAEGSSVTLMTPPHAPGVVDVGIRCGTEEFTLASGYTYTAAPPHITRITPTTGSPSGGTIVTVSGDHLPRGRCAVWFGDAPATTLQNLGGSDMSAVAPPHAAGAVPVTLRCGSDASTLSDAFVYAGNEPPATLASVTPAAGAPGERVLIAGSRFRTDDALSFGSAPALDADTAPDVHTVTVPDVHYGVVTVTLRDANGRTISGPTFTVVPSSAPKITSAPPKATAGAEIIVYCSALRPSFGFTIAGVPLQPVTITSVFAILRVPATLAPQQSTLAMIDASGTTLASRPIEVTSTGIAVESVTPQCVSTDGGTLVTIAGRGFQPGAVVTFGIADATEVTVRDAQTITARVPPSSGVSAATVIVTNPSLEMGRFDGFHYRWPESQCGARHRAVGR